MQEAVPDLVPFLSFNAAVSPQIDEYLESNEHQTSDKDQALRSKWVLWATQRVAAVTTAKEFWRYWNHMPQPSLLLEGKKFMRVKGEARHVVDALMIFKDGIRPEWEDAANAAGGHFTFQLKAVIGGGVIDEYWNNIVLGVIGGSVEPDIVTGLRLVDKLGNKRQPHLRIEVWFSNVAETEKVDKLQQSLEKCMLLRLDGAERQPAWGKVERTSHAPQGK